MESDTSKNGLDYQINTQPLFGKKNYSHFLELCTWF